MPQHMPARRFWRSPRYRHYKGERSGAMEAISSFGHILLGMAGTGAALYTIGADLLAVSVTEKVRSGPVSDLAVSLTFDDGPDPVFKPRVLDILAPFGVHASFFSIGNGAGRPTGYILGIH